MSLNQWLSRHLSLAFLLLGALSAPSALWAQASGGMIISVPDRFPEVNGRPVALVLTEADRSVIVLRRDRLNPRALEAALRIAAKAGVDEIPAGQATVDVVTGFVVRRGIRGERMKALRQVIDALRGAPTSSLGSMGTGRWVRWYPEGS
jgi:hypothetical protein